MHLMDYSLLVGIHDIEIEQQMQKERIANTQETELAQHSFATTELHQQQCSDIDSGGEQVSPPESPIPSTGAFTTENSGGLNLDDEFFAIPSSEGFYLSIYYYWEFYAVIPESNKKLIYFIGLVDILTYYGVKKRTESAAKSVKYGSEADNISTVKPEQVNVIEY